MPGSYFKITLRNMLRNKMMSVVFTPRQGIAACLLLTIFDLYQANPDPIYKNVSKMVRVSMEIAADRVVNKASVTGKKVFPDFKKEFPEVGANG
jgi:putative ABC transport system permease protein